MATCPWFPYLFTPLTPYPMCYCWQLVILSHYRKQHQQKKYSPAPLSTWSKNWLKMHAPATKIQQEWCSHGEQMPAIVQNINNEIFGCHFGIVSLKWLISSGREIDNIIHLQCPDHACSVQWISEPLSQEVAKNLKTEMWDSICIPVQLVLYSAVSE